mmetsp:Transcript_149802/g.272728  ORF Transcript_149802/g.272728 Transcript_149802/m.272728 type:complete len:511 (-) Transcript_149802:169-1701(-)
MLMRGHGVTSNRAMVEELEQSGTLTTPDCIRAFHAIDRRHFWVPESGTVPYVDLPLRHGLLHQSAPHIYARALESLMPLKPGMSFLNVGSGTGYFSSLVSELIGDSGIIDGLDIWPETVAHAQECCQNINKGHLHFAVGNVYQLDVDQGMRYDRIYLGACANSRSKYLYRLLEVGGVLVGPFQAGHMQQLRRVVRKTEAHFVVEILNSVQFSTLVEPTPVDPQSPRSESADSNSRSIGLRGVPFTFALRECPWSLERNMAYPASFRQVADVVLNGLPRDPEVMCLPPEIWVNVLPWCSRMWFDVSPPPAPIPSAMRNALKSVGQAAKKAILRGLGRDNDNRSNGAESDSSDGGSTRVSGRLSRTSSDATDASSSSDFTSVPQDGTLYEALGNSRMHAIGSQSDPDDLPSSFEDMRPGMLVALLEANMRTRAQERPHRNRRTGWDEDAGRVRAWYAVPAHAVCRCIRLCCSVAPRVGMQRCYTPALRLGASAKRKAARFVGWICSPFRANF